MTSENAGKDAGKPLLQQIIYDHGGSRIWIEQPGGKRGLMADTYGNAEYAKAVHEFTEKWLKQNEGI
jgi:hypothetical protein